MFERLDTVLLVHAFKFGVRLDLVRLAAAAHVVLHAHFAIRRVRVHVVVEDCGAPPLPQINAALRLDNVFVVLFVAVLLPGILGNQGVVVGGIGGLLFTLESTLRRLAGSTHTSRDYGLATLINALSKLAA